MNIYLIKPKFPVTYWGFEYSNDLSGATYTSPPLGLATIAALTPPEHHVEICDENIEPIDYEKNCDIVGLTGYLMQGPQIFQIAQEFRRRGKFVVLGGPITGLNREGCRGKADVIFVGEAEYTWKQFLDDYQRGTHRAEYAQVEHVNMQDSPAPRMDLLKLDRYVHAAIQTTRGCPFGCEFCDIVVLFGRKVRFKSVAQVIAEMREAAKQKIDAFFFTDDNFIGNKAYAKELLHAIIELNKTANKPFEYMTQVSINLAKDDELLELMHKANFTKLFIGIETPRRSSLQEVNKRQNVRSDLLQDVKKIQAYNMSVSAGMIVGFDHDDQSIFQEQLQFIMDANIPWSMTGILQAVPETPMYKRLQAEGRLDASAEYFEVDNTALDVNIIPKLMTKEELVKGYTWLVKQLYSYENYAKRVIGSLQAYRQQPKPFTFPSPRQLATVWRTARYFLFTLDRRRRKFFCEILNYTLRYKRHAFVDAMTYIVSFKHLHTYVYEYLDRVLTQKEAVARVLPDTAFADMKRRLLAAYEDLRSRAADVSAQTAAAYEELKASAANMGKQAAGEYDELRKHAALLNAQAATAYDELKSHAANMGKYVEDWGKQTTELSRQAATRYEELRQQAGLTCEQATAHYEELRREFEDIRQQVVELYQELSAQAAAMKMRTAGMGSRLEDIYRELEEQAAALSRKTALMLEELEAHLPEFSSSQTVQAG